MYRNIRTAQLDLPARLLLLVLVCFVGFQARIARAQEPQSSPSNISDLLAVKEPQGTTIYIADENSAGVFYYEVSTDDRADINLDKFRRLPLPADLAKPFRLAFRDGKLLVFDKSNAIYEVDLFKKVVRLALQKSETVDFSSAVSLSISGGGSVAIGRDEGITIYPPDLSTNRIELSSKTIGDPTRIFFEGSTLFVFDDDNNAIFRITNFNSSHSKPDANIPTELITNLSNVEDVAYRAGLFFLVKDDVVSVLATPQDKFDAKEKAFQQILDLQSSDKLDLSHISVTDDRVFVGDKANRKIWLADLPSRLARLQLNSKYLVWLDKFTQTVYRLPRSASTSSGTREIDVTRAEKIWSARNADEPSGIALDGDDQIYVVGRKSASIVNVGPNGEQRDIHSGPPLVAPTDVAIVDESLYVIDPGARKLFSINLRTRRLVEEYDYNTTNLTPDRLIYSARSVAVLDTLAKSLDRFLKPEIKNDQIAADTIAAADSSSRTLVRGERLQLEKTLTHISDFSMANNFIYLIDSSDRRIALLPVSSGAPVYIDFRNLIPSADLLTVDNEELYLADSRKRHFIRSEAVVPYSIDFEGEWTPGYLVEFYLYLHDRKLLTTKNYTVQRNTPLDDLVRDLDLLPVGYVDYFEELFCLLNRVVCEQWSKNARSRPSPDETPIIPAGQILAVPEVKLVPYSATRPVRLPLELSKYKPRVFRKYINGPLGALAREFKPDTVKSEDLGNELKVLNPYYTGDNILDETKGFFVIPIKAVTAFSAVPQKDLRNKDSALNRIVAQENVTGLSPSGGKTPVPLAWSRVYSSSDRAISTLSLPTNPLCRPIENDVLSNAMRLIRYCLPIALPKGKVVQVGVIDNQFNSKHEVFKDAAPAPPPALEVFIADESAPERTLISSDITPSSTQTIANDPRTNYLNIDHGTYIAALIGARQQPKQMVGFMPQSKLIGIQSGNPLGPVMDKWRSLRLFNVSLGEDVDSSPTTAEGSFEQTEPIVKVITNFPFAMFVVAAGNSGQEIQPRTLASFGDLDNVIVVGASDSPLVPQEATEPPTLRLLGKEGIASNYHNSFVVLVAPGENIKSALYNGQYGFADGTSQSTAMVTGAVAILMAVEPLWKIWQYKARLVASADLWPGIPPERKIFGGTLNVERAVLDTDVAVIDHETNGVCKGEIDTGSLDIKLKVRMPFNQAPLEIPWRHILRIERSPSDQDLYTVIYYKHRKVASGRKNFDLFREQIRTTEFMANSSFRFNVGTATDNCRSGNVRLKNLKSFLNTFYASADDEETINPGR